MCWSQTNVIKKQPYTQYRHTLGPYLHCSAIKKERAMLAALTQNRDTAIRAENMPLLSDFRDLSFDFDFNSE